MNVEDALKDKASVVGAFMALTGIATLLRLYFNGAFDWELIEYYKYNFIPAILFIVIGAVIALAKGSSPQARIGLATLLICASTILRCIWIKDALDPEYNNTMDPSIIVSYIGLIVGASGCIASFGYIFGYRHRASRLMIVMAIFIPIDIYPVYVIYDAWIPLMDYAIYLFDVAFLVALYVLVIIVLFDREFSDPLVSTNIGNDMRAINTVLHSNPGAYILPCDLETLKDSIANSTESQIDILGEENVLSFNGSKVIITPKAGAGFSTGLCFKLSYLADHGDSIRLYGSDGLFVQLQVHEIPERKDIFYKIEMKARSLKR